MRKIFRISPQKRPFPIIHCKAKDLSSNSCFLKTIAQNKPNQLMHKEYHEFPFLLLFSPHEDAIKKLFRLVSFYKLVTYILLSLFFLIFDMYFFRSYSFLDVSLDCCYSCCILIGVTLCIIGLPVINLIFLNAINHPDLSTYSAMPMISDLLSKFSSKLLKGVQAGDCALYSCSFLQRLF